MNTTALERPDMQAATQLTPPPKPHPVFGDLKLHPYTFWLPDSDQPGVTEWAHKNADAIVNAIKQSKVEQDWDRWCDAAFAESLKDEPPYDWGGDEP